MLDRTQNLESEDFGSKMNSITTIPPAMICPWVYHLNSQTLNFSICHGGAVKEDESKGLEVRILGLKS